MQTFVSPVHIDNAAYILIALGAFIFILSFLGYCGSIKESRVLLTAYGIFIILIFCMEVWKCIIGEQFFTSSMQIAVIVLAVVYKESHIDNETKGYLTHTLKEHYSTGLDKNIVAVTWDQLMKEFECCGVMDSKDFAGATKFVNYSRVNQLVG